MTEMSSLPISSPCINVCTIDGKTSWCLGCGRTLKEIAAWSKMNDVGRLEVAEKLPARQLELAKRFNIGDTV